ncbi:MAG: DUF58 domain-containing protein [Ruminococcaceae bacterium]|nr:DUF58 domain-containing protein [Oscillospiraceae bacterium]
MDYYKKRPLVKFHKATVLYAALLVFGIFFTQALRSRASSLLFWFLVLLPIVSIIYVLVGKALIRIYVDSSISKVEKMQPVDYEMRIINSSPFAYPFIEAVVIVPEENGVRCTEQSLNLSLNPLGMYIVKHRTIFKYRGNYEIGVRCLYISDFLGIFSIRLDVDIYNNVIVFPRKLNMEVNMQTSATDIPNDSASVVFANEKAEISNIREYIPGDSLKSIHWKLSSKTPNDLMVKDFNTNTSRQVYMLCDFSRAIPPEVFMDEDAHDELEKAKLEAQKKARAKQVKLKSAKPSKESIRAEKIARKAAKRAKAGVTESTIGMVGMVDDMIEDAAKAKAPSKMNKKSLFSKKNKKPKLLKEIHEITAEEAEANRLAEQKKKRELETKAALSIGGNIKTEFAPDMDEFCTDGVVELAIGAILNELGNGNQVNLMWTDKRQDNGIAAVELTCSEDFDAVYPVFATTPLSSEKDDISSLLPLITESLNVTIRICTSNIDQFSLNKYCMIPGLFGGAGTGCVAEVLLFNPEDRYEDVQIRREYVEMCRTRLAQDGVTLTEMKTVKDSTGNYSLRKASDV